MLEQFYCALYTSFEEILGQCHSISLYGFFTLRNLKVNASILRKWDCHCEDKTPAGFGFMTICASAPKRQLSSSSCVAIPERIEVGCSVGVFGVNERKFADSGIETVLAIVRPYLA